MKLYHWTILAIIISIAAWAILKSNDTDPRAEVNIDLNWRFLLGDVKEASEIAYDDSDWKIVSLPHDWMIEQAVSKDNPSGTATGYYPEGVGWYRKHIDLSQYNSKKQFYLIFDGVYMNSDVWINGTHVGNHIYGYIGFQYDITEYIRLDTINIIAVKTDCSQLPVDRWYSGAGIYRHVRLIAAEKLHFPEYNTHITTREENNKATVTAEISVSNFDNKAKRVKIKSDLLGPEGKLIASVISSRIIEAGEVAVIREKHTIQNPKHWSPDNPELYELRSFLIYKKEVTDNQLVTFGVRTAEFNPDSGFILNGKKLWLKGVYIHHDGGELGAAIPDITWEYRLKALKKLGVNALRLAHNPHAPEILDICDRMGFLVINEMYDKWDDEWSVAAREIDIETSWKKDLEFFIQRDINHPSVILWNIRNDTIVQLRDSKEDIKWYSEINMLNREIDTLIAGQFIQAGIDYLREAIYWPNRGKRNGLLQTNGFIKPYAYYTQSIYSDEPMVKMVVVDKTIIDSLNESHSWQLSWAGAPVVRHWTFPIDSEDKMLLVYTNCEQVELKLNSRIIHTLERSDFEDKVIKAEVPYEPGILIASAKTLNSDGKFITISDTLKTAGAPAMIIMKPDKLMLIADGHDVLHIKTSVTDTKGIVNPTANHLISYTLDGPGKISVIDNGDLADQTPAYSKFKRVVSGRHLVIVKSSILPGDLTISASAEGLIPASIKVKSIKPTE